MLNNLLQFLILKNILAQENIGGVLWTFIQKIIYFYLILLDQRVLSFCKCKLKLNQKLLLCSMKFCVETWEKMQQKAKAINRYCTKPFSFIRTICKVKKSHCMDILILENTVQSLTSPNCGSFQLYFYKNLNKRTRQKK